MTKPVLVNTIGQQVPVLAVQPANVPVSKPELGHPDCARASLLDQTNTGTSTIQRVLTFMFIIEWDSEDAK